MKYKTISMITISTMFVFCIMLIGCGQKDNKVTAAVENKVKTQEKKKLNRSLTDEQWLSDIDFYAEELDKRHPNLFFHLKKEDFQNQIDDLKKEIPNLEDEEIKLRLIQITASLGDAHTSIISPFSNNDKMYPVGLYWFGDELYVLGADSDYKEALGKKLVSINDIPIEKIIEKINTFISHENDQWLKACNPECLCFSTLLRYFKFTEEDSANFTFVDLQGEEMTLNILAKNTEDFSQKFEKLNIKNIPVVKMKQGPYWCTYVEEDKILYFRYNICIDRDTIKKHIKYDPSVEEVYGGKEQIEKMPSINDTADEIIKIFRNKQVDKFIIDMRNNTGGNSEVLTNFIERYKRDIPEEKKSPIFVMVGRKTFSSALLNCYYLKEKCNAVFFGEPTGGKLNCYGDVRIMELSNSKLTIGYSTRIFKMCDDNDMPSFVPDYIVDMKFEDYLNGIDPVYEAIKKYN